MFSPLVAEKGNSNVLAHFSSIRVFTVGDSLGFPHQPSEAEKSVKRSKSHRAQRACRSFCLPEPAYSSTVWHMNYKKTLGLSRLSNTWRLFSKKKKRDTARQLTIPTIAQSLASGGSQRSVGAKFFFFVKFGGEGCQNSFWDSEGGNQKKVLSDANLL